MYPKPDRCYSVPQSGKLFTNYWQQLHRMTWKLVCMSFTSRTIISLSLYDKSSYLYCQTLLWPENSVSCIIIYWMQAQLLSKIPPFLIEPIYAMHIHGPEWAPKRIADVLLPFWLGDHLAACLGSHQMGQTFLTRILRKHTLQCQNLHALLSVVVCIALALSFKVIKNKLLPLHPNSLLDSRSRRHYQS